MKLLLTSSGVTNRVIAKELHELIGKSPSDTKIAYIPTASGAEGGNKDWVIYHLLILWKYGYNWIDIVDPTARDSDWESRLEEVDVLYISGGNTFHLLNQARATGLDKWLNRHKDKIVYIGESASSILVTPSIAVANVEPADNNIPGLKDLTGLGWVDFEICPHVPSDVSNESAEKYAATTKNKVYVLDDSMAVKVDGSSVVVVGEGVYKEYNAKA